MLKKWMIGPLVVVFALLAAGCGSSNSDDGTEDTGGSVTDTGQQQQQDDAVSLEQCDDCVDFVVDRIVLPVNYDLLNDVSRDIDGDGTVDNAIGKLMAQVLQLYSAFDAQEELDDSMNEGDVLAVVRLTTDGGVLTEGNISGQLWVAESEPCCTSSDATQCALEAQQSCYGGDYTFQADVNTLAPVASGTLNGGRLSLAGEAISFKVSIFGEPVTFEIRETMIEGELSGDRIVNGKISGVIDKSEVSKTIVLQLAQWVNARLSEEGLDPLVKQTVLNLLDENKDGVIGISEISDGDLLGPIFSGDVDPDGDGSKEISVAFGYTAVPAHLTFPN